MKVNTTEKSKITLNGHSKKKETLWYLSCIIYMSSAKSLANLMMQNLKHLILNVRIKISLRK